MLRNYTGTTAGSINSSFTGGYATFDYLTPTTTNPYFDRINYSDYYSVIEGTGYVNDYFNGIYFTIPFEIQPISQPDQPVPPFQPSKPNPEEIDAQDKARKLLLEYLDHDNKQKYLEKKPIEIGSKLFNDIIYQIPISKFDKICALKEGKIVSRLCLVVKEPEQVPLEDVILTKLLHLLHDEECVLRTANHFNVQENLLARLN